jgi:hypothetical protein
MSPFVGAARVEDHYNAGLFRVTGLDAPASS